MEAAEQVRRFEEFFEDNYKTEILESARKGKDFIAIDFKKLAKFDPELAESLLEEPDEVIAAAELAVKQFDIKKKFNIRFKSLPESQKIMIRNIRSVNLNKMYVIEGIVRQKSDVRPQVTAAKFECPSCGNIINVLQLEQKFKEPSRCGCGRKGKFRLLSKELIDAQGITLEEAPEDLEGGEQPKRMRIFLKNDLVSPISDKYSNPGSKILVNGVIKETPLTGKDGTKLTRFDLLFEANYMEPMREDYLDLTITKEEEREIRKLAADPDIYEKIANSMAPSIYGHDKIKEALVLQLVGGVKKERTDGIVTRGDMHILLIGDPGAGKSQLLKRFSKVAPKSRYVSGKGVSGAGLTASVVKDEFLGGWALEAGALPLCNRGFCCIDEMDKMSTEDTAAMHEALEGQTITISKANIQATLRAETTVLAAANPKFGRFDQSDILAKQISMPPTLINRFDLIFPIMDVPDEKNDEKLAKHILALHKDPDMIKPEIDSALLRKFIVFARQKCKPVLTDAAINEIKKYYVDMRSQGYSEERAMRAVPISPRQLEGLLRLSEASAKIRLDDKVTKKDARRAIELVHFCLSQVGLDPETGKIDIDRISTGITTSQRSKIFGVKDIIVELENKIGKIIPIEDVVKECEARGIDRDEVEEVIEKLKRSGDIFEPKHGFIGRMP
jgi:replicative DNA helicase Mcm